MILFVESCLRQHQDATVQYVHRCLADYLKLALYHVGGEGRGCHAPTFVSTFKGAVTEYSCVTGTVDDSDEAHDDDEGDSSVNGDDESEVTMMTMMKVTLVMLKEAVKTIRHC